ncbi:hypothetical protein PSAC2689_100305 [Paraburkholderia sacchari]
MQNRSWLVECPWLSVLGYGAAAANHVHASSPAHERMRLGTKFVAESKQGLSFEAHSMTAFANLLRAVIDPCTLLYSSWPIRPSRITRSPEFSAIFKMSITHSA